MNQIAELFGRITLGVYVVGVAHEQRRGAFTASWIMPASYDPPTLALSVNTSNACHPMLLASGSFAVSVLKRGQLAIAEHFGTRSGRDIDKLAGVAWRSGYRGAPILRDAAAYFECELTSRVEVADRDLIIARVIGGEILDRICAPMSYAETGTIDASSALYPASF